MSWAAAAIILVSAAPLLAQPAAARPDDLAGWQEARWGMTAAALDRVFGGKLTRLAEPLQFGGAYAEHMMAATVGGVRLRALFQMGASSHRLQQVMLEARGAQASPAAHRDIGRHLEEAYGPADATCVVDKVEGEPMLVERVWRFPTTTLHALFIDFQTTGVFSEAPFPHSLTQPSYERRRNHWRTLPRRIVLRFHDSGRTDLLGNCRIP